MPGPSIVADFATADDYLAAHDEQIAAGGLLVRGADLPAGTPLSGCTVVVRIAGVDEGSCEALLASATPGLGVTVLFLVEPTPLVALAARLRDPAPSSAPRQAGPPARDLMTLPEKLALAMTGDREVRMRLLRDPNKQLHPMVLKNPRIGLEEIHFAARLATLNPDALKIIAEHPEWGQNPTVASAVVRNPKTPLPVALKLVPRMPSADLRALSKSQGKPQLVQAAKKLLLR